MKKEEKILTLHPQGKTGVNISLAKYEMIRDYILAVLHKEGATMYKDVSARAEKDLADTFEGSIVWYVVSVKLDLEARGIIERIPNTSPHKIQLSPLH